MEATTDSNFIILAVGDAAETLIEDYVTVGLEVVPCSLADVAAGKLPLPRSAVLLCDFNPAGQTGLDLLRTVREAAPGIPVVIVLEAHELRYGLLAMLDGAAGYVVRSCNPGAFRRAFVAVVARYRLNRSLDLAA